MRGGAASRSLPIVAADRVCLEQVVLNLIVNAMDALDQVAVDERRLTVTTRRREGTVELAVNDSGHGIPAEGPSKLFDAFFTTEEDGLGLGLAIARSIVESPSRAHLGRGPWWWRCDVPLHRAGAGSGVIPGWWTPRADGW
jgi:C4-dicarboxylate-specific signal transduction histidine kinase